MMTVFPLAEMETPNAIAIVFHLFAINLWIGGTVFIVLVLNHAAKGIDSSQHHQLMQAVLSRFFTLVWIAMLVLLCSGSWMIYGMYDGLVNAPLYIILMMLLGLVMVSNFLLTYFGPYRHYRKVPRSDDSADSRVYLAKIRLLSWVNVILGACVLVIIGGGHHLMGS